jgi:hypothetical protein
MKKILLTTLAILFPLTAWGYTGTWSYNSTSSPALYPTQIFGKYANVVAPYFTATTTNTNTFPNIFSNTIFNGNDYMNVNDSNAGNIVMNAQNNITLSGRNGDSGERVIFDDHGDTQFYSWILIAPGYPFTWNLNSLGRYEVNGYGGGVNLNSSNGNLELSSCPYGAAGYKFFMFYKIHCQPITEELLHITEIYLMMVMTQMPFFNRILLSVITLLS